MLRWFKSQCATKKVIKMLDVITWWAFDETEGLVVYDSTGVNDGTNSGAVIGETGILGNSYLFDGGDICTMPNITPPNNFSYSVWIKPMIGGIDSNFRTIFASGLIAVGANKYPTSSFGLFTYSTTRLTADLIVVNTTSYPRSYFRKAITVSTDYITEDQWNHIAFTKNYKTIKLYINGVLRGEIDDLPYEYLNPKVLPTTIGRERTPHGTSGFKGHIDELLYTKEALTEDQIKWLYNNGKGVSYKENVR